MNENKEIKNIFKAYTQYVKKIDEVDAFSSLISAYQVFEGISRVRIKTLFNPRYPLRSFGESVNQLRVYAKMHALESYYIKESDFIFQFKTTRNKKTHSPEEWEDGITPDKIDEKTYEHLIDFIRRDLIIEVPDSFAFYHEDKRSALCEFLQNIDFSCSLLKLASSNPYYGSKYHTTSNPLSTQAEGRSNFSTQEQLRDQKNQGPSSASPSRVKEKVDSETEKQINQPEEDKPQKHERFNLYETVNLFHLPLSHALHVLKENGHDIHSSPSSVLTVKQREILFKEQKNLIYNVMNLPSSKNPKMRQNVLNNKLADLKKVPLIPVPAQVNSGINSGHGNKFQSQNYKKNQIAEEKQKLTLRRVLSELQIPHKKALKLLKANGIHLGLNEETVLTDREINALQRIYLLSDDSIAMMKKNILNNKDISYYETYEERQQNKFRDEMIWRIINRNPPTYIERIEAKYPYFLLFRAIFFILVIISSIIIAGILSELLATKLRTYFQL